MPRKRYPQRPAGFVRWNWKGEGGGPKRSIYNRETGADGVHSKVRNIFTWRIFWLAEVRLIGVVGREFEIGDFRCRVLASRVSSGLTILSLSLSLPSWSCLISLFLRHAVLIDEHRQSSQPGYTRCWTHVLPRSCVPSGSSASRGVINFWNQSKYDFTTWSDDSMLIFK